VFELAEIDESNWRRALAVEVRTDQVPFVADHQPVALVILSKCYVRPGGNDGRPTSRSSTRCRLASSLWLPTANTRTSDTLRSTIGARAKA
jgi:hypothetical protein